jgi:PAS domain S-box-containing protein
LLILPVLVHPDKRNLECDVTVSDSKKTKKELLSELQRLRARLAELEQQVSKTPEEENLSKSLEQLQRTLGARTGELMMLNQELHRRQAGQEAAEQACLNSTAILDKIFSTSQVSIALLDKQLNFIRVNEGYAASSGHPAHFFPGKNHFELYPSEKYEAIFRQVLRTGEPYSDIATPLAYPALPPKGTTYWDWNLLPVKGASGEVEGLLLCSIDVSSRVRAEEASRQSERLSRRLFDEAPIGAAIVGLDYRFQRVNEEFCRLTGYSAEEMTSMAVSDLIHPDGMKQVTENAQRLLSGEVDHYQVDRRYLRKDNRQIWARVWVRLLRNDSGDPICYMPLVEDITDRRKAEEALRESEERYRLHFENVSDVVYVTNRDFRIIDVSPSVQALTGYTPEEIIGRRIDELNLLAPEYVQLGLDRTLRILEGQKGSPTEYEFITKDGTRKTGEISGSALIKDGEIVAVVSVARDITARKKIEEELTDYRLRLEEMVEQRTVQLSETNKQLEQEICERNKAEENLRNQMEFSERLIDSSADGIIAFDREIRFTVWNPPMERVTGVPRENVIGKNAFEMFPYLKETGEDQSYLSVLDGKPVTSKGRPYYIQETGREGYYEAHYSPLRSEDGEIIGGLAIIRDITQRKQMEEVLRESEARYRHLSESLEVMVKKQVAELKQSERLAAIGKMISIVAHEIRNPLQNVMLGLQTLRMISKAKEQIDILDDIDTGIDMLSGTMEELLDFSRPARLNRAPWKIEDVINRAVNLLRPKLQNIIVTFDISTVDEEMFIDGEKMARVLLNLIVNAVEAMTEGGSLHLQCDYHETESVRAVKICVSDTGPGIPDDILLQIEEPFFTTKPRGTGLGLSICRKIIEAHKGKMEISSMPGKGTRVDIIIPAELSL